MRWYWTTPGGTVSNLYVDASKRPHTLIAGASGSGKSVVVNGILHAITATKTPSQAQLILIDPKRVELAKWRDIPHTLAHAAGQNPELWQQALTKACDIMDKRYTEMERHKQVMYDGSDIYVVIDEYAMLATCGKRSCYQLILRLLSEGRAARVHVIAATQVPKANIIPTEIRENFTARICLRCNSTAQSRVLMDVSGCETLPEHGQGYYVTPGHNELYLMPKIDDRELDRVVTYWTRHKRPHFKLF